MRPTMILVSLLAGGGLAGLVAGLASTPAVPLARAQTQGRAYLPLGFRGVTLANLPVASTALPPAVTATATADPSDTPTVPPTDTPSPEPSATYTEPATPTELPTPAERGKITGRLLLDGLPAGIGLGEDPGPGLVLRRCTDDRSCTIVARTGVADDAGGFVFDDPASLPSGAYYQVTWINENPESSDSPFIGAHLWLGAWYGTPIRSYTRGQTLDTGVIELADVVLTRPTHGTGFSGLPLDFGWNARSHEIGDYSWAICLECCQTQAQRLGHYHTPSLDRRTTYRMNEYPPGTMIGQEHKYCWFVRVEGQGGAHGESFHIRMLWFFFNGFDNAVLKQFWWHDPTGR